MPVRLNLNCLPGIKHPTSLRPNGISDARYLDDNTFARVTKHGQMYTLPCRHRDRLFKQDSRLPEVG